MCEVVARAGLLDTVNPPLRPPQVATRRKLLRRVAEALVGEVYLTRRRGKGQHRPPPSPTQPKFASTWQEAPRAGTARTQDSQESHTYKPSLGSSTDQLPSAASVDTRTAPTKPLKRACEKDAEFMQCWVCQPKHEFCRAVHQDARTSCFPTKPTGAARCRGHPVQWPAGQPRGGYERAVCFAPEPRPHCPLPRTTVAMTA